MRKFLVVLMLMMPIYGFCESTMEEYINEYPENILALHIAKMEILIKDSKELMEEMEYLQKMMIMQYNKTGEKYIFPYSNPGKKNK